MFMRNKLLFFLIASVILLVLGFEPGRQAFASAQADPIAPAGAAITASLLGPEFQISDPASPEPDRYLPAVAYNSQHHEYLVVWHNTWPGDTRDIYARRVSETGKLLSWFTVSAGPNDRSQPAVAYNATNDEYLVVWMYNPSGDDLTYEIWGRIVAWNGASMGAEFQIITWPNRTFWTPRLAWNSLRNEYLVVWSAFETPSLTPTDVAHALLAADGTKLYGTIISSANQPHQADVTYNPAVDEYMVVWRRIWTPGNGDIQGARIAGGGATVITPPGEFTISGPTEDQNKPSVATNQQNSYLVVWEHVYPGPCCDWDIRAQELDNSGNLVGNWFAIASTSDDETSPRVAAHPGAARDYLVAWQQTTSAGEAVNALHWRNGSPTEYIEAAVFSFWDAEKPAVASGSPRYFIVYEGDSQGDPTVYRHIYGRLWTPNVVFLPFTRR